MGAVPVGIWTFVALLEVQGVAYSVERNFVTFEECSKHKMEFMRTINQAGGGRYVKELRVSSPLCYKSKGLSK